MSEVNAFCVQKIRDTVSGHLTVRSRVIDSKSIHHHHHHHYHHVHEGLGVFLVPWSSKWSRSLHLFFGSPMFLRPFGLYCSDCFGILFVSILCTCCSHFFWYCFISFTMFCAPVLPLAGQFIRTILLNLRVQYSIHNSSVPLPILSQINTIHNPISLRTNFVYFHQHLGLPSCSTMKHVFGFTS